MTRAAAAIAVLALAVAVWHVPGRFREGWREIRNASALQRVERELAPARSVGLQRTEILTAARRLIPADATYYVTTAPTGQASTPADLRWFRAFASYWLLPRRRMENPADAAWVVSYLGRIDDLGLRYARVVRIDRGITLAEVAR